MSAHWCSVGSMSIACLTPGAISRIYSKYTHITYISVSLQLSFVDDNISCQRVAACRISVEIQTGSQAGPNTHEIDVTVLPHTK